MPARPYPPPRFAVLAFPGGCTRVVGTAEALREAEAMAWQAVELDPALQPVGIFELVNHVKAVPERVIRPAPAKTPADVG